MAKQKEKEDKIEKFGRQNEDIIRLGIEIRDALHDMQLKLHEMDKILTRQAKKPKVDYLDQKFFYFNHLEISKRRIGKKSGYL